MSQGPRVTAHAVLLDLQAHQLPFGEGRSEDLREPDGVHPLFHPCCVEGARSRSSHARNSEATFERSESIHLAPFIGMAERDLS